MQDGVPASSALAPLSSLLLSVPAYTVTADTRDVSCRVWRNPGVAEFSSALAKGTLDVVGLRAILTDASLFLWQSSSMLHGAMAALLSVDGVRVRLQPGRVLVNQEACALPEHLPWVFSPTASLGIEARRIRVACWMHRFPPMIALYPHGFETDWYM